MKRIEFSDFFAADECVVVLGISSRTSTTTRTFFEKAKIRNTS
jgi:hypothetical protein